jgi:hypothetical protein
MQRRSLAALAALTFSGTMYVAWNQQTRLPYGDHLRWVSSAFDASIFMQPDSGVDGGTTYDIVLWVSASYGSPLANYGPPYYSGIPRCLDDASICAYRAIADAGVVAAVEPDAGLGITPQVGAIQVLGRALNRPVILVDCPFPGAPVALYNLATCGMYGRMDDAVAFAVDAGATPRISILTDNSGGFNEARAGSPFSSYIANMTTHRNAILTHIAARADAGVAGYGGSHPVRFAFNSGTAQHYNAGGIAQHPYADDFVTYTSDAGTNSALCGELYFVETGADNLHPSQAGGIAMADLYGRCWARMLRPSPVYASAVLTNVVVESATDIRATFFLPCRAEGTCLDNVPITVDTTNVALQQTTGNVNSYGFHFYSSGVIQTPGAASSATGLACAGGSQYCDVRVTFANMPASFDSISYADTAQVNTAVSPTNARGGGGNFIARLNADAGAVCGADSPCGDWTVANVISGLSPYDGGPLDAAADAGFADAEVDAGFADAAADAGFADAAPDAAPSDSGIHPDAAVDAGPDAGAYSNQYFIASNGGYLSYNPSGGALNLTSTFTFCFALRDRVNNTFQSPIGRWGSPNDIIWGFGQLSNRTPRIYAVGFETGGIGFDINTPVWVNNTWIQACVVFNGTSSAAYINGVAASLTYNGTIPSTLTVSPSTPWHILAQGSTHADLDSVVFYDTVLTQAEMDDHRCAFTSITNVDGGANPCSGQSLGQVVANPGFIEAYLFDSPDAGPGASYTGTRDFSAVGSVSHTASPLP